MVMDFEEIFVPSKRVFTVADVNSSIDDNVISKVGIAERSYLFEDPAIVSEDCSFPNLLIIEHVSTYDLVERVVSFDINLRVLTKVGTIGL